MTTFLARDGVEAILADLMTETPRTAAALFVAPNALRYMRRFLPLSEIQPDNLRHWVSGLELLAAAVDATGPSSAGAQATRLEEWARTARGKHLNRIFLIFGLVSAAILLALFWFAWLNVGSP